MYSCITFLTDFGMRDDFVGVCRGVMKRIAPDTQILDLTHGITPQGVTEGALMLARAIPYLPEGVHLAVIDPGVGSERRAVAIRTNEGRVYVGPDNGLLTLAAQPAAIEEVRALTNHHYHLEQVSKTFHARDLFAPAAAHIALGVEFSDLGDELDPSTLVRIELPKPEASARELRAKVLIVDRFGNLILNVSREHIDALGLTSGDQVELRFQLNRYFAMVAETYADAGPGELLLYEDSYGGYAVAISNGDASRLTSAVPGDLVRIGVMDG